MYGIRHYHLLIAWAGKKESTAIQYKKLDEKLQEMLNAYTNDKSNLIQILKRPYTKQLIIRI